MGQHEIAMVQTTGATAYVSTCNFIAVVIYPVPPTRSLKTVGTCLD
jgi:hypothetical protein